MILRRVLAGVLEHSEEQPRIHSGEVLEVGREILATHDLAVHLQMRGDLIGPLSARDETPEEIRRLGPPFRRGEQRREYRLQHARVVERVERQSVAAADEHEAEDALRMPLVELERHLHAHRMAEEHGLPRAARVERRRHIAAQVVERDAVAGIGIRIVF